MLFYLQCLLFLIWIGISTLICIVMVPFRWKDTNINHDYGRILAWGLLKISRIRVEVEGLEHLETHQPCIYAVNHHSELDLFTFASFFPHHTVVIGKKELIWIPLFGIYFVAAGNVTINRQKRVKAISGLNEAVKVMQERKDSIWIFPEGTRNHGRDLLLPFKKGAFFMAQSAGVPVVPVVAEPVDRLIDLKGRVMRSGVLKVRVLPPIRVEDCGGDVNRFLQETHRQMVEALRGLVGTSSVKL